MRLSSKACGFLIIVMALLIASAASATPVLHTLTLTITSEPVPSPDTFVGSFAIDDSLLGAGNENTFIPFSDFTAFDITILGSAFSLSDAQEPTRDGVITDGAGAVLDFDDNLGGVIVASFRNAAGDNLLFADVEGGVFSFNSSFGGSYTIEASSAPVPEPSAAMLFSVGSLLLVFAIRDHAGR